MKSRCLTQITLAKYALGCGAVNPLLLMVQCFLRQWPQRGRTHAGLSYIWTFARSISDGNIWMEWCEIFGENNFHDWWYVACEWTFQKCKSNFCMPLLSETIHSRKRMYVPQAPYKEVFVLRLNLAGSFSTFQKGNLSTRPASGLQV